MLRRDVAAYCYGGEVASRLMRSWKIAPNDIVPCKDGHVFIAAVEETQWQRLVDLMGRPAWAADGRFRDRLGRAEHWDSLKPLIEAWSLQRSKAEICQAAQASRVPISPVNTAADLLASPHLAARGFSSTSSIRAPARGRIPVRRIASPRRLGGSGDRRRSSASTTRRCTASGLVTRRRSW